MQCDTIYDMKNKIVKKANVLIEGAYRLSTVEQRVIMLLVTMIKPSDEEFKDYFLVIKDFVDILGLKHKDPYLQLREITKKLMGRVFTIKTPKSELQLAWLSSAEYLHGEGKVKLRFDPGLKPYLLQLKERFTSYNLNNIIRLKSSFSIRIYELLKQYEKISTRTFTLKELKRKLGISQDQYKLYGHFKSRVLNAAQVEINSQTDISFDFEEIRIGRKIGKIHLIIRSKSMEELKRFEVAHQLLLTQGKEENQDWEKLAALLPDPFRAKISVKRLVLEYLNKFDFDYVVRNIEYTNAKSNAVNVGAALGKGSNYRNYLAKALRADFGLPFKEDLEALNSSKEAARKREIELKQIQESQADKLRQEQKDIEQARIYQESLSTKDLQNLRKEALESLDPQHKDLVLNKATGSEMLLKMAMNRLCLKRLHINPPIPAEKEKTQES